ncbi:MAG TPA: neocarzinostatin apoprotein domain-containing protein [Polyangiaceae bacterium]|nr:neocarzinostatin apoprotein domain-containing protein [Polyangiaceae bacterium]
MRTSKLSCLLALSLSLSACSSAESNGHETSGAALAPGENIQVTPDEDLVSGQSVTISVSGYAPATSLLVGQCASNVGTDFLSVVNACRPLALGSQNSADASGNFTTQVEVLYEFTTYGGRFVRCDAPGACVLGTLDTADYGDQRLAPLAFRYVEPPPPPVVSVSPATGLYDAQTVTITGQNFRPGSQVGFAQCRTTRSEYFKDCEFLSDVTPGVVIVSSEGTFGADVPIQYVIDPPEAEPFSCTGNAACNFNVFPGGEQDPVQTPPITFHALGEPRLGTFQLASEIVPEGSEIQASGAGWGSYSTVVVSVCAKHSQPLAPSQDCFQPTRVFADAQGAFARDITVPGSWPTELSLIDCGIPGACYVRAADSRNPGLFRDTPITVERSSSPRGSVTMHAPGPLVDQVNVRVEATGFQVNSLIGIYQCHGAGYDVCRPIITLMTDAEGAFEYTPQLLETWRVWGWNDNQAFGCPEQTGCALVVADPYRLGATAVRLPVEFSTAEQISITSHYEPKWADLLQQGLSATGYTSGQLQHVGALVTLWSLRNTNYAGAVKLPLVGTIAHTTTYARYDYAALANHATAAGYTVEEVQKLGALFYSWVLAGQPPIPE